jgi:WD40 repeat protein
VRCVAFDPSNEWFCTGSSDRTIKLWDTGSGQLKLTLTGHIEQVTGLAVSPRHPYMFSCSLDKEVKCWDLEHNKVRGGRHWGVAWAAVGCLGSSRSRTPVSFWHVPHLTLNLCRGCLPTRPPQLTSCIL